MAANKPLVLPAKQFTGLTPFVYNTADYTWTRRPLRSSDKNAMPMAWTSYQQWLYAQALDGTPSEASWIASHVVQSPAIGWAKSKTLIRRPRLVLMGWLPSYRFIDKNNVFTPSMLAALAALDVTVAFSSVNYANQCYQYSMLLPHEAEHTSTDTNAEGTFNFTSQNVTPANWLGGQVQYLDQLNIFSATAGPGAVSNATSGAFYPVTNYNTFQYNQIQACFPRYERFGYHLGFALPKVADFTDPGWPTSRPQYKTLVENAAAALAAYGVTETTYDGIAIDVQAACEANMKQAVVDFWGL